MTSRLMIGQTLTYYGSSRIYLVFFYLLLVSLRLLEARRKPQDTPYYDHVSIARLSVKALSFPLLLWFWRGSTTLKTPRTLRTLLYFYPSLSS